MFRGCKHIAPITKFSFFEDLASVLYQFLHEVLIFAQVLIPLAQWIRIFKIADITPFLRKERETRRKAIGGQAFSQLYLNILEMFVLPKTDFHGPY